MIEEYKSIKEIAEEWSLTPRRVRTMCFTGRVEGAVKFGRDWMNPSNTIRSKDGRVTTREYKDWRRYKEEN